MAAPLALPMKIPNAIKAETLILSSPAFLYCNKAILPAGRSKAAKEVPEACCAAKLKIKISAGTITIPPPIPNIPASNPAKIPSIIKDIIIGVDKQL